MSVEGWKAGRHSFRWVLACLISVLALLHGCAPAVTWVRDDPDVASCDPDRLLQWQDFTPKVQRERRAAETAVRFRLADRDRPRIVAQFDPTLSWVRADFLEDWNPFTKRYSQQLLRHEQLHYSISCLLAREANVALLTGGDPQAMLLLLNAVATRLNIQYDNETSHGLNRQKQTEWEQAIQARLAAGPLGRASVKTLRAE
jgi:hypothetical protein